MTGDRGTGGVGAVTVESATISDDNHTQLRAERHEEREREAMRDRQRRERAGGGGERRRRQQWSESRTGGMSLGPVVRVSVRR
ncbi:hypothetical protein HanIR_Chr15g0745551 [Helianthus annuus]|nr:hypothetical protein HanIR_Chr15g0745551 [Helianthus annuus]